MTDSSGADSNDDDAELAKKMSYDPKRKTAESTASIAITLVRVLTSSTNDVRLMVSLTAVDVAEDGRV